MDKHPETIFTKIIAREIPANIIYEDDQLLAFLDIQPVNPGHTLIIPKQVFVNIFDSEPTYLQEMILLARKISRSLKETGLATGVNIVMNSGEEAGQEIPHAHLHVIPRLADDGKALPFGHTEVTPEAQAETAARLRAALAN